MTIPPSVPLTASGAAAFAGGELIGDDRPIGAACTLGDPQPGALAFAKSWDRVTEAGLERLRDCVLLLPQDARDQASQLRSAVIVANPRLAFARLLAEYFQPPPLRRIAETARIGRNVTLGRDVSIGEFSVIGDGASIGDGTEVRHHVVIGRNVAIGRSCLIRSHSVIGEEGFGVEKDEAGRNLRIPHLGGVVLGDHVEIGALNTVCSGTIDPTVVGDFVKTDDHVHIAHNCRIGDNAIVTACAELSGSATIGRNVWLGPNCSVMNGITIGDDVFIGLGAVVTKSCEPGTVYGGSAAKRIRRSEEPAEPQPAGRDQAAADG